MSLRFDRTTPPKWNSRTARVDFACVDSQTRLPVHCAVSRAALEDTTGEALDGAGCVAMFARHLARVTAVASSIAASREIATNGVVLIDSDDLLQHFPVVAEVPLAAHGFEKPRAHATGVAA